MFTGLIQETGTVKQVRHHQDGKRLTIGCRKIIDGITIGSSVAVDGICLTVTGLTKEGFSADAVFSTIAKTSMAEVSTGKQVNLEPALKAGDPLDGHMVSGHVQEKVRIRGIRKKGLGRELEVSLQNNTAGKVIPEGSVALDGISLTVSSVTARGFCVAVIPETWDQTTLSEKKVGDELNIEFDMMLRSIPQIQRLDERQLIDWGY